MEYINILLKKKNLFPKLSFELNNLLIPKNKLIINV